ncbi:acyl-homoserine lactone synthase [Sphingobium sp. B2D3A]|uniref:acyl-homoserine-lactone synthase n=1 Tax=unclassified Sphingobium TaxID=2611147 RepID=UPI002225A185|nr:MULTISPECIES: acyl-homoserine-lactone synthase [unclassified Sphingobium]MCW2338176.1 acyl-homoserine lactone synthase [Sphingobium sp. B2D3A]MCW2384635.1 acyl-homoserine lactone synthase [Sphingobium sp. B2D3D]
MFEDRKRIFVDLLNWDVPVLADRYEVDQFDTTDAIYLVEAEDGEHYGSIRLLPTDVPHILGSLFPYLCDGRVPAGADVLEITRGCLSPRLRAAERLRVRNRLTTAAVHYALMHEVRAFSCVADSGWLVQILTLGWDCRPLGEPRSIAGVNTGALMIDVRTDTLAKLREAGTYAHTSIVAGRFYAPVAA